MNNKPINACQARTLNWVHKDLVNYRFEIMFPLTVEISLEISLCFQGKEFCYHSIWHKHMIVLSFVGFCGKFLVMTIWRFVNYQQYKSRISSMTDHQVYRNRANIWWLVCLQCKYHWVKVCDNHDFFCYLSAAGVTPEIRTCGNKSHEKDLITHKNSLKPNTGSLPWVMYVTPQQFCPCYCCGLDILLSEVVVMANFKKLISFD